MLEAFIHKKINNKAKCVNVDLQVVEQQIIDVIQATDLSLACSWKRTVPI